VGGFDSFSLRQSKQLKKVGFDEEEAMIILLEKGLG